MTPLKSVLRVFLAPLIVFLLSFSSPANANAIQNLEKRSVPGSLRNNSMSRTNNKLYTFSTDEDVMKFLQWFSTDIMLWRCKNAIQATIRGKRRSVELYCEVLGRVKSIEWTHYYQRLEMGSKYSVTAYPHREGSQYFSRWLDYNLVIHDATPDDSGMYSVRVTGASGKTEEQFIFVDIKKDQDDSEDRKSSVGRRRKKNRHNDDGGHRRSKEQRRKRRLRKLKRRKNKNRRRKNRKNRKVWQTLRFFA